MRRSTDLLGGVLTGDFDHHWSADLIYNGERRLQDVPLTDVRFGEDADAEVQQSGSCRIIWTDTFGKAMAPREITDAFTPFGAQLRVYSNITSGPFSERMQYGVFEITDVPSARDEDMFFRGSIITIGSEIELELKELLAGVGEESFDVPSSPSGLSSTWDEIGKVSGLQLAREVADQPITRTIMYPDSKLEAVYELMDVMLDCVAHMTADGALAARPNAWPAPVHTIRRGEGGQLVRMGRKMSADRVYNRVVVRATSGDQKAVLAIAEITEGPLRVREPNGARSPFGARTFRQSSEYVTTAAQAQAWADSTLPTVSTLKASVVPVEMTFDPRIERGDVILIQQLRGTVTGRVRTITRSARARQSLTVEIES
ncbi:hypothetical protein [Microbacterium sp. Leaf320]|uniref:hypothetical protein n=1 Tax=Microbacterium sp. Leaf320 TaxID=1736334 RepID=UPI000700CD29|nr:hypothetical protein [Microbacterium sp. Leaf320]KQQ65086.1 hypothetical protein ASF63_14050 [Microbacterium sp. Leaf320]